MGYDHHGAFIELFPTYKNSGGRISHKKEFKNSQYRSVEIGKSD